MQFDNLSVAEFVQKYNELKKEKEEILGRIQSNEMILGGYEEKRNSKRKANEDSHQSELQKRMKEVEDELERLLTQATDKHKRELAQLEKFVNKEKSNLAKGEELDLDSAMEQNPEYANALTMIKEEDKNIRKVMAKNVELYPMFALEARIDKATPDVVTSLNSLPKVLNGYKRTSSRFEDYSNVPDNPVEQAMAMVLRKPQKVTGELYAAYLVSMLILVVMFSEIVLPIYLLMITGLTIYRTHHNTRLVDLYIPMTKYSSQIESLSNLTQEHYSALAEQNRANSLAERTKSLAKDEATIDTLRKKIQEATDQVQAEYNLAQRRGQIVEELNAKYDIRDTLTAMAEEEQEKRMRVAEDKKKLQEIEAAMQEIVKVAGDAIFRNQKQGTSLLLPETIITDVKEGIKELDWNKRAMLVFYEEDTLATNFLTVFHFFLSKYMKTVKLGANLIDTKYAGSNLARFHGPQFTISSSNKETENVWEKSNSKMREITLNVLSNSSSIDSFNQKKISTGSDTTGYEVIYALHYSKEMVKDSNMVQVIRMSEKTGIIPIIFLHRRILEEIQDETKAKEYKDYQELIEVFQDLPDSVYEVKTETKEVKAMPYPTIKGILQKEDTLTYIKNRIKE